MDIAEIRKKAKTRIQPDAQQVDSAPERPGSAEADRPEPAVTPAGAEVETAVAVVEDSDMEFADGLDRLFAAVDGRLTTTGPASMDGSGDQVLSHVAEVSQYLAFTLADEEYALDIKQISEIIKVREFTDIPRAPDFVRGIISLRGVVVPVFDLRRRLNLGAAAITASSRIVVCQSDEMMAGLLVDAINQVVNLADDDIEPPPGVLSGLDRDMVLGLGRCQGRMIILLQLTHVLNIDLS